MSVASKPPTVDERRARWDKRYAAKELVWSAAPNQMFAQEVADLAPGRALDVGCGEGRNALWLAERGWQVTAIDFSSVAIDKAKRIAALRGLQVQWRVDDVSQCVITPGSFDLVAVLYLHTSAEDRSRWLANLSQALCSGGTFIYLGHDPSNIDHGAGGPQDPAVLPGVDIVCDALLGFEVVRAEVVERTVASEPGHGTVGDVSRVALDTYVRAVKRCN